MIGWKLVPAAPTPEMVASGARSLVSLEDESVWPNAWSPMLAEARNEAERVWLSMWVAAAPTPPVVLPRHLEILTDQTRDYAEKYARAALAQYGIVDRQEDAA